MASCNKSDPLERARAAITTRACAVNTKHSIETPFQPAPRNSTLTDCRQRPSSTGLLGVWRLPQDKAAIISRRGWRMESIRAGRADNRRQASSHGMHQASQCMEPPNAPASQCSVPANAPSRQNASNRLAGNPTIAANRRLRARAQGQQNVPWKQTRSRVPLFDLRMILPVFWPQLSTDAWYKCICSATWLMNCRNLHALGHPLTST